MFIQQQTFLNNEPIQNTQGSTKAHLEYDAFPSKTKEFINKKVVVVDHLENNKNVPLKLTVRQKRRKRGPISKSFKCRSTNLLDVPRIFIETLVRDGENIDCKIFEGKNDKQVASADK